MNKRIKLGISKYRSVEIFYMTIVSTIIGIIMGLASIYFINFLNFIIEKLSNTNFINLHTLLILLPIFTGILIGIIRQFFLPKDYIGFGVVPVIMELLNIKTFLMKPKDVLIKFFGMIISISGGFSVGRFGPVVHLGGAIGSLVGYKLKLNDNQIRLLIGCGVSASIAGFFNAPIFASLFVLTVLFERKFFEYFTHIVISAITSVITAQFVLGDYTVFKLVGEYGLLSYIELINYIYFGLVCGCISILYMLSISKLRTLLNKISSKPYIRAIIGGLIISFIGFFVPGIFELYNNTIHNIFEDKFGITILLILILAKILATSVSLGCGGFGGSFTPGLFIGAALGSAYAQILDQLFHISIFNYRTYAIVGMGALFSGFANTPLTATIMVLELTNNYNLILPILVATTISSVTAEMLTPETIYTQTLKFLQIKYLRDD